MRLNGVDSMEGLGQDQRKMVGDIVAIGENINRLNAGTPAGKMLTPANLAALSQQVRAGTANFEAIPLANGNVGFAVSHEGRGYGCRSRWFRTKFNRWWRRDWKGALSGRRPGAVFGCTRGTVACRAGGIPRSVADAAPRASAREHLSQFGVRRQRRGRAAGCRARPVARRRGSRAPVARQAPGLKAGAAARDRHAAEIAKAERDVELARTAERAAAERWSRATDGSPIARAAMGQTTAE